MASTSETGHAKNVATFQELISFAKGLGLKYNPSKESIQITALEAMQANAGNVLGGSKTAQTAFDNATGKRAMAFDGLRKLATRVVSAYSVYATEEELKDLKSIQRKMQGTRAGKLPKPAAEGQPQTDKTISVSQQSFDSLMDHFTKIIETVKAHPAYKPNEAELTTDGLKDKLAELKNANAGVIDAYTIWNNSLISRNEVLYNPLTGLVALAAVVKNYIRSVFGHQSPQHKQVSALKFTTVR